MTAPGTRGRPDRADSLPTRALRFPALALLCGAWLAGSLGACAAEGPAGPGEGDDGLRLRATADVASTAPAGTVLPEGPAVAVRDGHGEPLPGVAVEFRVVEGGGRVDPHVDTTDARGRAGTAWVLGPEAGTTQRVEASAGGASIGIRARAETAGPGERHEGREGYTVWLSGDLPLILSVPHGGELRPAEIPERSRGTKVKDGGTLELAGAIRAWIEEVTGRRPHVVFSALHRTRLDPNREIGEAAQGHPLAERAWHEYHAFLEAARERVRAAHGTGLLLDVHGHGHELSRVELGYLLERDELALSDSALAAGAYAEESSVRELAERSPASFPELVRGEKSLGGLLEARGVEAVPGPSAPDPGGFAYFTGGYITRRHGSVQDRPVSAIQLEHPGPGVRESTEARLQYAVDLTEALGAFFPAHFGRPLARPSTGVAPGAQSK